MLKEFIPKRQRRRSRGKARAAVDRLKQIYSEPSCATCSYASWQKIDDYYNECYDIDLGCNYPSIGNLGTYRSRVDRDVVQSWHDAGEDYAQDCDSFKLAF